MVELFIAIHNVTAKYELNIPAMKEGNVPETAQHIPNVQNVLSNNTTKFRCS
jgi:hypothetical protein